MITLSLYQKQAAELIKANISTGGDVTFNAPTGAGKTIIWMKAAIDRRETVLFVSQFPELRKQVERIAKEVGLTKIETAQPLRAKTDQTIIDAATMVVLCESLRSRDLDALSVIALEKGKTVFRPRNEPSGFRRPRRFPECSIVTFKTNKRGNDHEI